MIRIITKARLVAFTILVLSLIPHYSSAEIPEANTAHTSEILSNKEEVTRILESFLNEQDVLCLAKNIYYESRGEPKEGKVAVGMVTINRVGHPGYPNSICDVIHHRTKSREGKTVCQFSWACMKLKAPKETDPLWVESLRIAKKLLTGQYTEWQEKYKKAHHFHSVHINPGWRLKRIGRIGRHIIYH